ncbi:MAG TPA: LysM peptidoglycan-binding domain-containing protein [Actinomycetales bacterium]|nr:LysM peptidoglycan-binding domain-containing protein [Actinomycetales bacterium]
MLHLRRTLGFLSTAALVLTLAGVAYLLVGWAIDGPPGAAAVTPAVLDLALARVAALTAAAVLGWWSVAVLTCLVSALHAPGGSTLVAHVAARTLPRPLRAVVAAAVGMAIAAGTTTPALATATDYPAAADVAVVDPAWMPLDDAPAPDIAPPQPVAPGWAPARPTEVRQAASATLVVEQSRPGTSASNELVVRRGDTLWDICARHLSGDATDAEIAAEWPRWYQANRQVIGADPDRLQPGQRLSPPSTTDAAVAADRAGRAG